MQQLISGSILVLLLLGVLVGCSSEPVSISSIPVFPDAAPLEAGQNDLADRVLDAMVKSAEEQSLTAHLNLYSLPDGTSWQAIQTFYNDELSGSDWKSAPELGSDGDQFNAVGWTRGSGDNEQSLVVNYVPDVIGQGAFLLVGLFSE